MTSSPTTQQLSEAELGRYLGRMVQYEEVRKKWIWESKEDVLIPFHLMLLTSGRIRNIRPVLRWFSSITTEEARECFRLAYYHWDEISELDVRITNTYLEMKSGDLKLVITNCGVTVADKEFEGKVGPARFNAVALVDYLESICIDVRGYIQSGKAVTWE